MSDVGSVKRPASYPPGGSPREGYMGNITDQGSQAFREYNTDGVPASGPHEPVKAEVRSVFGTIDSSITSLAAAFVANGASVVVATKALLTANLAPTAGSFGIVYNDTTAANNGIYVKSGASGTGSWSSTGLLLQGQKGDDGDAGDVASIIAARDAALTQIVAGGVTAAAAAQAAAAGVAAIASPNLNIAMPSATVDASGNAVSYIDPEGVVHTAAQNVRSLNGFAPSSIIRNMLPGATSNVDRNIWLTTAGASINYSKVGGGNITVNPIGKARGWPSGVDNPTVSYPLTGNDIRISGGQYDTSGNPLVELNGEPPMCGMIAMIYQLLRDEDGLSADDIGMIPYTSSNSGGSQPIVNYSKGTAFYNRAMSQLAATIATGPTRAFGEAIKGGNNDKDMATDTTARNTYAPFLAKLRALARDVAADQLAALAAAGMTQTFQPHIVNFQDHAGGPGRGTGDDVFGPARATLRAAIDFALGLPPSGSDPSGVAFTATPPIGLSCPTYAGEYLYDPEHQSARGSLINGAYDGLYFKRVMIDGAGLAKLPPIHPIKIEIAGEWLYVTFLPRFAGTRLRFGVGKGGTGEAVPKQANFGFSAYDKTNSVALTFASEPEIVAPWTMKYRRTGGWSPGMRLEYCTQAAVEMGNLYGSSASGEGFGAPAGNIRDDYGRYVRCDLADWPMHNWMPLFRLLLTGSGTGFVLD